MATTNTVIPTELPTLTLEQVRQKLVALLSEAGDLGAYIESVIDGKIVIKNFTLPYRPGCSTKPKQTVVGQSVPDYRLQRVSDAILSINEDFQLGRQLRLALSAVQPACLGTDDMEFAPPPPQPS